MTAHHSSTHRTYQGNISLMMLFVLAIGSLIGLMSTWFIQDMIASSGQIRDFYQSYYIAKGWLELGTLAVNRYEYGFEDYLSGTQAIINNNLNCTKDCNLDLRIQSRINTTESNGVTIDANLEPVQTCNTFVANRFTLRPGESRIIPLFADQRKLGSTIGDTVIQNILSNNTYNLTLANNDPSVQSTHPIGVGIVLGTTHQQSYDTQTLTGKQALYVTGTIENGNINIMRFLYSSQLLDTTQQGTPSSIAATFGWNPIPGDSNNDRFNYLYITNLSPNLDLSYCLNVKPSTYGYISDKSIVTAISSYSDTTLWLQAQVRKPLLEYIIRPYGDGIYSTSP